MAMLPEMPWNPLAKECSRVSLQVSEEHLLWDCETHFNHADSFLSDNDEIVTLVLGTEKVRIRCYKLLAAYWSRFFDAAMYGGFIEQGKDELELPKDDPREIRPFTVWLVSGFVPLLSDGTWFAKLWVLGDKLLSVDFKNTIMLRIIEFYMDDRRHLRAATAEYVFNNTTKDSKLRSFMKALIRSKGPLADGARYHDEWLMLLEKGGPLVLECSANGGFHNQVGKLAPRPGLLRFSEYLECSDRPDADEWLVGKI